jgi:DNA-binding CsgD family transcriptional regulator
MLNVRGQAPKDIARQLGLSVHYVRDLIQGSRVRLGIAGRRMTLDDLVAKDSPR